MAREVLEWMYFRHPTACDELVDGVSALRERAVFDYQSQQREIELSMVRFENEQNLVVEISDARGNWISTHRCYCQGQIVETKRGHHSVNGKPIDISKLFCPGARNMTLRMGHKTFFKWAAKLAEEANAAQEAKLQSIQAEKQEPEPELNVSGEDEETEVEELRCIVCLVNHCQLAPKGCYHYCLCFGCASKLPKKECPKCRGEFKSLVRVRCAKES